MTSFLEPLLRKSSDGCALVNNRTGVVLADRLIPAFDSATRRTGLLQHGELPEGSAMIIAPSNAIHTFFMKFPIDLVYLDKKRKVRKVRHAVPAWRLSACLTAHSILELPAGTAEKSGTLPGDELVMEKLNA